MKNKINKIGIIMLFAVLITLNACKKTDCGYTPCGGISTNPKVDLIVLIDGSGSMSLTADSISKQAELAIQDALIDCPSDLRVTYLSMGYVWPGTKFNNTHRNYLTTIHGAGVSLAVDRNPTFEGEQGANGIEDLSNLFDWRKNACKTIFYISDEELHSGPLANFTVETMETQAAIDAANKNGVTVSANYLTYQNRGPQILANYQDLTSLTGGQLFTNNSNPLPSGYYTSNKVFNNLVCNACSNCVVINH